MPGVAIALDGQSALGADDHQVDVVSLGGVLRDDCEASVVETVVDALFEQRVERFNAGVLGNGAIPQPLNAALRGSPRREVSVEITKGNDAGRLAKARDVLLWVEYDVP